ncbi:hypothetical protein [Salinibaculum rarum]|jgi:hypothetical protein|uniref:hypothetical protein n=1 Tax=Salinibaculum rarum TaxID=3058903 RepID=UPI00265E12F1|nr:hypothetical protein [Salinibaculum sp. KK48]
MATVDRPSTHREELNILIDSASKRFAAIAVVLFLGAPIVTYLSGDPRGLFYVHVALGAFWFGLDFFFKFVLGPSLDAAGDEAAAAVNAQVIPKMVVIAEPLSVGVIGSGIALADLMGYWADPSLWLWAALGIGTLMLLIGFGPLHLLTTRMSVELSMPDPDGNRLDELFGKTVQWGMVQTILMLAIILTMTALRWGL